MLAGLKGFSSAPRRCLALFSKSEPLVGGREENLCWKSSFIREMKFRICDCYLPLKAKGLAPMCHSGESPAPDPSFLTRMPASFLGVPRSHFTVVWTPSEHLGGGHSRMQSAKDFATGVGCGKGMKWEQGIIFFGGGGNSKVRLMLEEEHCVMWQGGFCPPSFEYMGFGLHD